MALIKWLSGVSGNWTNAADWAGGIVPGAADDVTIDASGVYGVTISSADAAHSLTLNDPTATLSIVNGGTLTLGTTLTANFGTVDLYGGVIAGGTLSATGGKFLWDGTVEGVTVDGTIDLSGVNARLFVTGGGLVDKGAHGTGAGTILLTGGDSELGVEASETLDNATLDIGNGAFLLVVSTASAGATLTLGPNLVVDQTGARAHIGSFDTGRSDTILNRGVIEAGYKASYLAIGLLDFDTPVTLFENAGSLQVTNGDTVTVQTNTFVNTGGVSLAGGSRLSSDCLTVTNAGTMSAGQGDYLFLYGQNGFTNAAGASVTASAGATVFFGGDLANAGTIAATGAKVTFENGITNTGVIDVTDSGVTLTGTSQAAELALFAGEGNAITILRGQVENAGGTISIGAGTALGDLTLDYGSLVGGTIIDAGGGLIAEEYAGLEGVDYEGTITVSGAGASLDISGGFVGQGADGSGAASIVLAGQQSRLYVTGSFTNTDVSITGDEAFVILGGKTETLAGLAIDAEGTGDAVDITGNLSGGGSVVTLGAGDLLGVTGSFDNLTIDLAGDGAMIDQASTFRQGDVAVIGASAVVDQMAADVGIEGTKYKKNWIYNEGTINAGFAGGSFSITCARFYKPGTIAVSNRDTLSIDPSVGFVNLASGVLSQGVFQVSGASELDIHGSGFNPGLTSLAASLVLDGAGSTVEVFPKSGPGATVESSLATIASAGVLELLDARGWSSSLAMQNAGVLEMAGGTFAAASLANGGAVTGWGDLATTLTNSGNLVVEAGESLSLVGGVLTNLTGGTLTGGTYLVATGATLQLANDTSIVTLDASLILEGTGSTVQGLDTSTDAEVGLKDSLTSIAAGGVFALLQGRVFTTHNSLDVAGVVQLGGGSFSAAGLTLEASGALSGFGQVNVALADGGLVEAGGGALVLAKAVTGAGALSIDDGATLQLSTTAGSGLSIDFGDTGATLALGAVSKVKATLSGFAAGDAIDLLDTAATGATLVAGDKLAIKNGKTRIAILQLSGDYSGQTFHVGSDGAGGSLITLLAGAAAPPPSPPPGPPPSRPPGPSAVDFASRIASLGGSASPALAVLDGRAASPRLATLASRVGAA